MKSCRKQQTSPRQTSGRGAGQSVPVHRYVHPIQTAAPGRRGSAEELLAEILNVLSRQEKLLEEVLRRTGGEGYNIDT